MYSALEGVDEVVESFSQSFSSLRLPAEGQEEKPSAESGLEVTHKRDRDPTTEARWRDVSMSTVTEADRRAQRDMGRRDQTFC